MALAPDLRLDLADFVAYEVGFLVPQQRSDLGSHVVHDPHGVIIPRNRDHTRLRARSESLLLQIQLLRVDALGKGNFLVDDLLPVLHVLDHLFEVVPVGPE
jgi:hypothetical protein